MQSDIQSELKLVPFSIQMLPHGDDAFWNGKTNLCLSACLWRLNPKSKRKTNWATHWMQQTKWLGSIPSLGKLAMGANISEKRCSAQSSVFKWKIATHAQTHKRTHTHTHKKTHRKQARPTTATLPDIFPTMTCSRSDNTMFQQWQFLS